MGDYWFYRYKVEWFDEFKEDTECGGETISNGLLYATDFKDAIDRLYEYYGEKDLVKILYLEPIYEGSCIELEELDSIDWNV